MRRTALWKDPKREYKQKKNEYEKETRGVRTPSMLLSGAGQMSASGELTVGADGGALLALFRFFFGWRGGEER